MKNPLAPLFSIFPMKYCILFFAVLSVFPAFSQKNVARRDSLARRDSVIEMMFQGALLSIDALQTKSEAQKLSEPIQKRQKAAEAENLFLQSRQYYWKAIKIDKNYYPAWTNIGTTYYMQDLPKASIPCYRKALLINENYSSAWYNLGVSYDALAKKDSAIYSFHRCIRTDSTYMLAYIQLSRLIMLNGKDSASALNLLRLAAFYKPTSEVPWVTMSTIYISYNDSANAMASLEKAAQIYKGDLNRLQNLANYFQRHNDQKKTDYYLNLLAIEKRKQEVPIDINPDK